MLKSISKARKTKGASLFLRPEGVCFAYTGGVKSGEGGESFFLSILICQAKHTIVPLRLYKTVEALGFLKKYSGPSSSSSQNQEATTAPTANSIENKAKHYKIKKHEVSLWRLCCLIILKCIISDNSLKD